MEKLIEFLINVLDFIHQNRIVRFFKKKKIDILIDVGSHKGEFIKYLNKNISKKIYAFEPQPKIFKLLKKNVTSLTNIEIFNLACSDKVGQQIFYINALSLTSSLKKPNESSKWSVFKKLILQKKLISEKVTITTSTVDNTLYNKLNTNDRILLKIDVEGHEYNVLKGALKTLRKKNVVYIQVENTRNLSQSGNDKNKVKEMLLKNGYKLRKSFLYPIIMHFSDDIYVKN